MGRHAQGPGHLAPAEHLDQAPLRARPRCHQVSRVISSTLERREGVEVDRGVLDPERVLEAPELRDALHQRSWPPSKPAGMCPRAFWPLVPRPAVLPPLPPMPRPTRRLGRGRPGRRCELVELHRTSSGYLFTLHQVGHPGEHAPDLGTVGQLVVLADAPEAQGAQRPAVLGLGPDGRADLGHPMNGPARPIARRTSARAMLSAPPPSRARSRAAAPGRPGARRPGSPRRAACPASAATSSGRRSGLQPGDGGVGHVDAVGGAERLGQDVADARPSPGWPGRHRRR